MSRITDKCIAEVRDASAIEDVIGKYVALTEVEHTGYEGNCPFCEDDQGRFKVNPSLAMFMCRSCGVGGDITTFVMLYRKVSFREAMAFLAGRADLPLEEEPTTALADARRRTTTEKEPSHG